MATHTTKNEKEVLDFVFKENSNLEANDKEKNINTYYAIKYHLPSELFDGGLLTFNYNRGISYIAAHYKETLLFKMYNNKSIIEIICPADKNFINSLKLSDAKKEKIINKLENKKLKYWHVELTTNELLTFKVIHWDIFSSICKELVDSSKK